MRYLILSLAIVLSACASSQTGPVGTKSSKAYQLFGEALLKNDLLEYDEAIKLLDKAIKKDEGYKDAWLLKGDILLKMGRQKESIKAYKTVLSIKPDDAYAIIELGKLMILEEKYDSSVMYLKTLEGRRDLGQLGMEAMRIMRNARFGADAIKSPVPFSPVNMGPEINTEQEEYFPGLTVDEQTFYFTRRDASLNIYKQNEDLFTSNWDSITGWSQSKSIGPPVNTERNEGAFATSPDGRYLFFTACGREGGVGRCDIWYTRKDGDKWLEPRNFGTPLNSRYWDSQPTIASDGVTIYFASDRPGGFGGSDIWMSTLTPDGWSVPVNLGETINTPLDEEFPFIHPDGQTLYFTSMGHAGMGNRDIFITRREGDSWSEPVNLGYPINRSGNEYNFIVNRDGKLAFFASDSQEETYGGMDIYTAELYPDVRPQVVSYVKGNVYDAETGEKLQAGIDLKDLSNEQLVASTYSDRITGEFLIPLPSNKNYAFKVEKKGYALYSANFSLKNTSQEEPFTLDIALQPIKIDLDVVLENIFFETNKSELLDDSKVELNSFVSFLKTNDNLKVEISGHTDNIGTDKANQTLSENRAKSVYDYLISQGIDASRLTYKGYGAKKPRATNDTEEGRAKNRRTEFRIIGM